MKLNQVKTIKSRIRLINFAVDLFVISILITLFKTYLSGSADEDISNPKVIIIVQILIFIFYYFLLEVGFGRTVGKLITGTKVVRDDGEEPKASIVFIRTLIRIVPILNIYDALTFINTDKTGLHDYFTSTKLVKIKDLPSE